MTSTSIMMRSMEAIQAGIQSLSLTGLASTNVLIHKVPRDIEKDLPKETAAVGDTAEIHPLPAVIISPRDAEGSEQGTNLASGVVYPIQVVILDQDGQSQTVNFDRYLVWRESIFRKFNDKRLSGIDEVIGVKVDPKVIVDAERWIKGQFVSAQVLMVNARLTRL